MKIFSHAELNSRLTLATACLTKPTTGETYIELNYYKVTLLECSIVQRKYQSNTCTVLHTASVPCMHVVHALRYSQVQIVHFAIASLCQKS